MILQDKSSADNSNSTATANATIGNNEAQVIGDPLFANLGRSMITTLVMFVGEMNYSDLKVKTKSVSV